MSKAINWLKKYWYIPLFLLGSALIWIFCRRKKATPLEQTKCELENIRVKAEIEKTKKEKGLDAALELVEQKYQEKIQKMTSDQKKLAEELKNDPEKLIRFLIRVGSK